VWIGREREKEGGREREFVWGKGICGVKSSRKDEFMYVYSYTREALLWVCAPVESIRSVKTKMEKIKEAREEEEKD
jgi:hypothetical protein